MQNRSALTLQPGASAGTLANAIGGVINVGSGSRLSATSYYGYSASGIGNVNTTNNSLINVTGSAGLNTSLELQGSYGGAGLLPVRGVAGADASQARAEIAGAASGTFDLASGQLYFRSTPVGGAVNFMDNDGALIIDRGVSTSYSAPGFSFGASITGFQAGDVIHLDGGVPVATFGYDAASHLLTLNAADGTQLGQFSFAGAYMESDFKVTVNGLSSTDFTTTSTAQAVQPFSYTNGATGVAGSDPGSTYSGPVDYLQSQFIWSKPDSVALLAGVPNAFIATGAGTDAITASAGSNVLDGGAGSNFLTGATGADGGHDTFFLDATVGTTWDTIRNFHPGNSVTLWGFTPGQSAMQWAADEGAAGSQGATIHAALGGAGTPTNGSITFAGISLADAPSRFSIAPGNVGGRSYLYVHFT